MKTGLAIGDLHSGSQFAPFPDGFQTSYNAVYKPNIGQEYVNRCLVDMAASLPPLDFIILGGDMIDGQQPADEARYLCEPDPIWQARAAYELLAPILAKLKSGGKVFALEGTDYHDGISGSAAEGLAERCNAEPGPDGHFAWPWLRLDVDGVVLDCAHRLSYFLRYRATALEREQGFIAEQNGWSGNVDAIVRFHTHSEYLCLQQGLKIAIAVPGWQMQTHYAKRSLSPNRLISRWLGSVLLNVDASWRERGQAVVQPTPLLYAHPKMEGARL